MKTPAEEVGCCKASSKSTCVKPPCPCNLDQYSHDELYQLNYYKLKWSTENNVEILYD